MTIFFIARMPRFCILIMYNLYGQIMGHLKTYFDEWAPQYDQDAAAFAYIAPAIAGELLSTHLKENAPRIVDLGCGTGMSLAEIRKRFPEAHLTGVDEASGMMEEAKKKNLDAQFVNHDLSYGKIPLKRGVNDAVTIVGAMDFIPENRMIYVFRTAASLVKPDGLIVFTFIPRQDVPPISIDMPDDHPHRLLKEQTLERARAINALGLYAPAPEKIKRMLAGQNLTVITEAEFRGYKKGNTFIPYQIVVCRKGGPAPAT